VNILPIVFTLLLILGLVHRSLMYDHAGISIENRSIHGYFLSMQKARNKWQSKQFKSADRTAVKTDHQKSEKEKAEKKQSREKKEKEQLLTDATKFNLQPVLNSQQPLFYNHALELLRYLYEKAPFYQPGLERKILDQMIQQEISRFRDLVLDADTEWRYYKMVKGTHTYQAGTGCGYPPLSDFFCINSHQSKPINLSHVSRPIVTLLFGPETADLFAQERRQVPNGQGISKEKIQAIFNHPNPLNHRFFDLQPLFHYDSKNPPSFILERDENSGITAKRFLPPRQTQPNSKR
jgi:hypothetical protein